MNELRRANTVNEARLTFNAATGINRYKHFLYQFVCGGAIFKILLVHVRIVANSFRQVWKPHTIRRANLVNAAFVIRQVKKLARLFFIEPISILALFFKQPLLPEFARRLSEMS